MKYRKFVIKNLLSLIPIFFGVTFFTFYLTSEITEPIPAYIGGIDEVMSPIAKERWREELGLNKPIIERYFLYLGRLIQGDWGWSTTESSQDPVLSSIAKRLPVTAELLLITLSFSLLIGIPLGIINYSHSKKKVTKDRKLNTLFTLSFPIFVLGIFFQYFIAQMNELNLFLVNIPIYQQFDVKNFTYIPFSGFLLLDSILNNDLKLFSDGFLHIIAPTLSLSFFPIICISKVTKIAIHKNLKTETITLAKDQSFKFKLDTYKNNLRRDLKLTIFFGKFMLTLLLSTVFFIELIYEWPGLGDFAIKTINNVDIEGLMGVILVISFFQIISYTLIDIIFMRKHPIFELRNTDIVEFDMKPVGKKKKLHNREILKKKNFLRVPKYSFNYFHEYFDIRYQNVSFIGYKIFQNNFTFIDAQIAYKINVFASNLSKQFKRKAKKKNICFLCKNTLNSFVSCPFCSSHFHRDHFYEWLIVRRGCPHCFKKLTPEQLI